jgi:hypothetical protein
MKIVLLPFYEILFRLKGTDVKITSANACPEMLTSVGTSCFSELEILVRSTGETSNNNLSGIYTQMICVIQFYMFDSINDLIQLAHVLTSADCECVRTTLYQSLKNN